MALAQWERRGCDKTYVREAFARALGYPADVVHAAFDRTREQYEATRN